MTRQLDGLQPGSRGTICRLAGEGPVRRRILDMGLTPGAEVLVTRVAPLGDPIALQVKGYTLSLRRSEAATITVETGS